MIKSKKDWICNLDSKGKLLIIQLILIYRYKRDEKEIDYKQFAKNLFEVLHMVDSYWPGKYGDANQIYNGILKKNIYSLDRYILGIDSMVLFDVEARRDSYLVENKIKAYCNWLAFELAVIGFVNDYQIEKYLKDDNFDECTMLANSFR